MDRSDLVKGYETSKNQYVVVDEAELKNIAPPTATNMEIVQFVRSDEVDPIYFEGSYYVAPEESASKPYQLFLQALDLTKYHAIAKLTMHGREHIVLIRPGAKTMVLHTLFYENELHESNRAAPKTAVKSPAKEVDLAKALVEHLAAPFKPAAFQDTYRQNVERLIEQKRKGQKITAVAKPKQAPVIDLMDALKRSLASSMLASSETQSPSKSATKRLRKAKAA